MFLCPQSGVLVARFCPKNVPVQVTSFAILRPPSFAPLGQCPLGNGGPPHSNTSREGKGPMFSLCSPPSTSPHLHLCECSSPASFHRRSTTLEPPPLLRRTHLEKRNSVSQFPKQSDLVTSFSPPAGRHHMPMRVGQRQPWYHKKAWWDIESG